MLYSLSASSSHSSETACGRTDQGVCRVCSEREVPIEAVAVGNDLNQIVGVAIPIADREGDDSTTEQLVTTLTESNSRQSYQLIHPRPNELLLRENQALSQQNQKLTLLLLMMMIIFIIVNIFQLLFHDHR